MNTKTKEQQLKELQEQVLNLQVQIAHMLADNTADKVQGGCLIKSPEQNDEFYYLQDNNRELEAETYFASDCEDQDMHFADEEQCKRYAEALTTFILLRKQPGSCKVEDKVTQWGFTNGKSELYIEDFNSENCKLTSICPWFNSYETAKKALETVGEERIKRMMEAFHS